MPRIFQDIRTRQYDDNQTRNDNNSNFDNIKGTMFAPQMCKLSFSPHENIRVVLS